MFCAVIAVLTSGRVVVEGTFENDSNVLSPREAHEAFHEALARDPYRLQEVITADLDYAATFPHARGWHEAVHWITQRFYRQNQRVRGGHRAAALAVVNKFAELVRQRLKEGRPVHA